MCSTLHAPYFEQRQSGDVLENGISTAKKRRINEQSTDLETSFSHRGNVNSWKKMCYDDGTPKHDTERHPVRILERRYLLTKTGYKFLDVGITAVLPCCVHIVIGDCHGKEITLSPETWKELIDQSRTVLSHLQRGRNERLPLPMCLENGCLTLRFGKINSLSTVRLETPTTRLVVSMNAIRHMFDLDLCVTRLVTSLRAITGVIDAKLTRFIAIAATVDPANASKAIRESEFFDRNDIIDCELVTLCFGNTEYSF